MNNNLRKVLLQVLRILSVSFFVLAFGFPNVENVMIGVIGFVSFIFIGFVFFILSEKVEIAELANRRRNYVSQKTNRKRYH